MRQKTNRHKKYFNKRDFFKLLGFWLIGIGLNFIPLICANIISGECLLWMPDMYFLCISALALLFLEVIMFPKESIYKYTGTAACFMFSIWFYSFASLLLVYFEFYFQWIPVTNSIMGTFNIITLFVLLIFGVVRIYNKSQDNFKTAVNNNVR